MSDLPGTATHDNLQAAFARESQANRRYLWFAQQADIEGHPDVAALFRSIAEGETGHAHGLLEFLAAAGDPTEHPCPPRVLPSASTGCAVTSAQPARTR